VIPLGWTTVAVADLAAAMFDGPFGSALKTSDYTDQGVRVARLENIGHLRFREELRSFVSTEKATSLARHTLQCSLLVPDELNGLMLNTAYCYRIRTYRDVCEPKFLAYGLATSSAYDAFSGMVRGVTRPRIGLRHLAQFQMVLPPLPEQRRIVAKLDALTNRLSRSRAELDRVRTAATNVRTLLDQLESAILAKAFRGELVPQDPNDEPASVLLERIRAQRAAAPKPQRASRARPL
jgi:type I restriction enzyme S subunit